MHLIFLSVCRQILIEPNSVPGTHWLLHEKGMSADASLTLSLSIHQHLLSPNNVPGTLLAARDSELNKPSSLCSQNL